MPSPNQRRFAFAASALAPDTFEVVSFTGNEALSTCYAFDIVLVSGLDDLDPETVIASPAKLTLTGQNASHDYQGIVGAFEQTGKANTYTFYRVRLVPRPFLLGLGENNRIFLDKTLDTCLTEVFQAEGLTPGVDFELRLAKSYPQRPFVRQFRETSLAFANRWMERDGLYFFFEPAPAGAKMVVTDTKSAHKPLPGPGELRYETPSGLVVDDGKEGVFDFRRRLRPVPRSVLLKDWNYETPSVNLEAEAPVLSEGRGAVRLFGDHFQTVQEGRDLAAIRAEELLCRRDVAEGSTSFPGLRCGGLFRLTNHFQSALNREYLVMSVSHQGRQFGFLTAGLGLAHEPDGAPETFYRNTFTAIPSDVQFRPERTTPWPRQEGLLSGVIDAAGSGTYAEVDDAGRYKVKLAFDRSGREGGKASHWVRMAQPYGGADHGMHFPLHKGCEVVLACHDGDPDRPIILGAVPNPEHKSVVTSANQTRVNLETGGKNQIYFEDMEGSQRALLQNTPTQSFMRLGVPNDPFLDFEKESDEDKESEGSNGLAFKSPYGLEMVCGSMIQTYMIGYFDTIAILQELDAITSTSLNIGAAQDISGHASEFRGSKTDLGLIMDRLNGSKSQIETNRNHLAGELIRVHGNIDTLNGQIQQLTNTLGTLRGDIDTLAGEVTDVCETKTRLSGRVSELVQQQTALRQQNSTLAAEVQDLAQSKITLHGEVSTLAADVQKLQQETTALDAERNELVASNTQIGSEIAHGSTMDLTI